MQIVGLLFKCCAKNAYIPAQCLRRTYTICPHAKSVKSLDMGLGQCPTETHKPHSVQVLSGMKSKTFTIIIFRVMDTKDETKNANQQILSNSVMFSVLLQDWNSKKVCKACCHREIVSN